MPKERLFRGEPLLFLAAALLLLAMRAPFVPPTLEDIDSVNFDLGVHDFDPPRHQPHPPGYPLFIALAKVAHAAVPSHAAALATVSVTFGALAVAPLFLLFRQLTTVSAAVLAVVATLCCPLVWFNSVRPMSDTTGFFFVTLAQALLLGAALGTGGGSGTGRWMRFAAGALAGLSLGVRIQALFLVAPIFVFATLRRRAAFVPALAGFAIAVSAWLLPLLVLSGGPSKLAASFALMVRDAVPTEPLLVRLTSAWALDSARHVLVDPWISPRLAYAMLALAAIGLVWLSVSHRRSVALVLLLFLPYGVYHYLVQMTEATRYAIPIIPLVAFFAAITVDRCCSLMLGSKTAVAALFVVLAGREVYPALAAYHATPSPPAQAAAFLARESADGTIVSGHHVFARYLAWLPARFQILSTDPRQPAKPLFQYWKQGGRDPVLFLRDPVLSRAFQYGPELPEPIRQWHWPPAVVPFVKGERPGRVELVRVRPPEWFAESGFLLTFNSGPPERVGREPHVLYVRGSSSRRVLAVAGSVPAGRSAAMTVRVNGHPTDQWDLQPSFTVHTSLEPSGRPDDYVPIVLESPVPVLMTSVFVQSVDRATLGGVKGFYLPERDERLSVYRWMAPRASARVYLPSGRGSLRLRGRIPTEYYQLPVTLALTWNERPLTTVSIASAEFDIRWPLEASSDDGWNTLGLHASQHFIPDLKERTGDRRVLAMRIYDLEVIQSAHGVSGQGPVPPRAEP